MRRAALFLIGALAPLVQAQVIGTPSKPNPKPSAARCESYVRQLEELRVAERKGGSAQQMDQLNQRRRSIAAAQSKAGCS